MSTSSDHQSLPREPARGLIVLTCMDARVDPLPLLGLRRGDAHVMRNAGAMVTDDVLRGVAVSRDRMNTHSLIVVGHTDCAAYASSEESAEAARRSAAALADEGLSTSAALYDVETGALTTLDRLEEDGEA